MTALPQNIKERFYKTIKGGISPDDFEQWLYADQELAKYLNPDDYSELISFGFKKSGAEYELRKLLKKHIDPGEFETYKMLGLLYEAKQKNERLPCILMEFYDLYCRGYSFLRDLGLGIGFVVEAPGGRYSTAEAWDELTARQQKEIIASFSPELEECIEQVINWLETKKIVLTGEQNGTGHYSYKDLRTEKEEKSRLWVTGYSGERNILWDKQADKDMHHPLVFATANPHKFEEIRAMLPSGIRLLSLLDIGFQGDIPETGATLEDNALEKARYIHQRYHTPCFADDTGLEVEALDGAPGVYSARYAGVGGSREQQAKANMDKLLRELSGKTGRRARFRTVIAYIDAEHNERFFEGTVNGRIIDSEAGSEGFGYDPVFIPDGYSLTFAQMPPDEKNKISHRAIAFHKFSQTISCLP
jgi:XTP/dITP diphosphohydrolase